MAKVKRGVSVVPAMTLKAGVNPAPDRRDVSGAVVLRGWQAEAYNTLRGEAHRILLAPTGSGKSTLIKSLAAEELQRDPRTKVVIAVPQLIIARSFGDVPQGILCDGKVVTWKVGHNLADRDGKAAVSALCAFLQGKPGTTPESRTLVCSHQTLVLAHQRLVKNAKRSPWHGVSLYVDEAHHSRAEDAGDVGDSNETNEQVAALNNRLGQLVAHWLDRAPGPLLLATATWLRANLMDIVPKDRMGEFKRYVLTMERHLAQMNHLNDVSFRFLIGKPDDAIRALYDEGNAKTIAWLPHVSSPTMRALGGKHEALNTYQAAIGPMVREDWWTTTVRHKPKKGRAFDVRVLDFVTVEGREDRREQLASTIPMGAAHTPDLLWALGMGKEGFDWPELSRAIVIGARGSIPDVLQMMGRVMRDHPGKSRAEFNVILPHDGAGTEPEQARDYLKAILASMVIESQFVGTWPWRKVDHVATEKSKTKPSSDGTPDGASQSVSEQGPDVDDLRNAVDVVGSVVDTVIRGGERDGADAVVRGALTSAGVDASDDTVKRTRNLFAEWTRRVRGLPIDVQIDERDVFGCVHELSMRFGFQTLAELREALGQREQWATEDEVRERMAEWAREHGRPIKTIEWHVLHEHGGKYPHLASFQRLYGKTFAEIRDSARLWGRSWISLSELRDRMSQWSKDHGGETITVVQYNKSRTGWGPTYPHASAFAKVYKKTFSEVRDGARVFSGDMTIEDVLKLVADYRDANGTAPTRRSGPVEGRPGDTWNAINQALYTGSRSLPGGMTLKSVGGGVCAAVSRRRASRARSQVALTGATYRGQITP